MEQKELSTILFKAEQLTQAHACVQSTLFLQLCTKLNSAEKRKEI